MYISLKRCRIQEFILTVSTFTMHSIAKTLKWKPQKDRGAFLASSEDRNWEALGSLETPCLLWCSTTCWALQCVHFLLFLIIPKLISLSTKCFFPIFSFWQVIELIPGKDSQEVLVEQVLQILGKLHYYYYCYYLLVLVLIIFTVIFMAQYELPVPLCQAAQVITSLMLWGTTLCWVASLLGVPQKPQSHWTGLQSIGKKGQAMAQTSRQGFRKFQNTLKKKGVGREERAMEITWYSHTAKRQPLP